MTTTTEYTIVPDDILQTADACYRECEQMDSYGIVQTIANAILAERERCARLIEEGFDRGIESKHDTCSHGKFGWEDCESCAAAAIRKGAD